MIFSKYLSHENTEYVLISVAFLASHSSMKEAFIKQNLNAGTFLCNQLHKVGYTNETIHMLLGGWTRLTIYSHPTTHYLCSSWLLAYFLSLVLPSYDWNTHSFVLLVWDPDPYENFAKNSVLCGLCFLRSYYYLVSIKKIFWFLTGYICLQQSAHNFVETIG